MSRVHAIDGGMFGHALCEEPTGDTTWREVDVTCSECLDLVEAAEYELMVRLRGRGWIPERVPTWMKWGAR